MKISHERLYFSIINKKQKGMRQAKESACVGKMEKTLNRIHPVSDPEATYFLQVSWEKDLGTGFGLLLSDCQCAWTGTVSESDISTEAADIEMDREKYVEELRKALISGEESAGKYNFVISRDEQNKACHFSYERNLKDGSDRWLCLWEPCLGCREGPWNNNVCGAQWELCADPAAAPDGHTHGDPGEGPGRLVQLNCCHLNKHQPQRQ